MFSVALCRTVQRALSSTYVRSCLATHNVRTTRQLSTSQHRYAETRFSEKHEWIRNEDGSTATIGITAYAQDTLGEIVYIMLPEVGKEFTMDEECGSVESVKAVSDIYCPLTGVVTEVNPKLGDEPDLVNKSPLDEGWMFKLKMSSLEQFNALKTETEYEEFIKESE